MRRSTIFANRTEAGDHLARQLEHLRPLRPVVVGLPRGGVPVACRVAEALDAPLDVVLVRKLGLPFQPELAMGALGEDGVRVTNPDVIAAAGVTPAAIDRVVEREQAELERRGRRYRAGRGRLPLEGRVVVVVDDGIATGATARAACQVVRAHGAGRVVLAVPVAPIEWTERLAGAADELVAVATPQPFFGVGQFYRDFAPTTDEEVIRCLDRAGRRGAGGRAPAAAGADPRLDEREVAIEVDGALLRGRLAIPDEPIGAVVFAHGAGSSRNSPRNRFVASVLNQAGFATLLFDLLTEAEESRREQVFDIPLLAHRLVDVTGWAANQPRLRRLPVGYFGASTGAAAALWAAAEPGVDVGAVVSRGGRPDLARARLARVTAPTLLIVGSLDEVVLELNEVAAAQLAGEHRIDVVPGATHLFEEPGTLATAARAARDWFVDHLAKPEATAR